jgi:Modifier of rudimentary (Mod(r)) protein
MQYFGSVPPVLHVLNNNINASSSFTMNNSSSTPVFRQQTQPGSSTPAQPSKQTPIAPGQSAQYPSHYGQPPVVLPQLPRQQQQQQQQQQAQPSMQPSYSSQPSLQQTAPVPRAKTHTALPPVPSKFPELERLSDAEIDALLASEDARRAWAEEQEPVQVFRSMASSQEEDAMSLCNSSLELQETVQAYMQQINDKKKELDSYQSTELQISLNKARAILDSYSAPSISRSLERMSNELDVMSGTLVTSFVEGDSHLGFKEFKEEYISIRRRFHLSLMKAQLLKAKGLAL